MRDNPGQEPHQHFSTTIITLSTGLLRYYVVGFTESHSIHAEHEGAVPSDNFSTTPGTYSLDIQFDHADGIFVAESGVWSLESGLKSKLKSEV